MPQVPRPQQGHRVTMARCSSDLPGKGRAQVLPVRQGSATVQYRTRRISRSRARGVIALKRRTAPLMLAAQLPRLVSHEAQRISPPPP